MLSLLKLFVLLQFRALPSFLVRHFHVRHFQSTHIGLPIYGVSFLTHSVVYSRIVLVTELLVVN